MAPHDGDYAMEYENIVLSAFGKTWRREDPFGLGDADVWRSPDNELSGQAGHDLKFGLSAAVRKLAHEHQNEEVAQELMALDAEIWHAQSVNDAVVVLQKVKEIFRKLKVLI